MFISARSSRAESYRETANDRSNRVDLLAEDGTGRLFIIELQNETQADYLQRLTYGTAKTMIEHIAADEPYVQIRKIYSVSIVYFDFGKGEDYLYQGTTAFRGLGGPGYRRQRAERACMVESTLIDTDVFIQILKN